MPSLALFFLYSIKDLTVDERSRKGIFVAYQHPQEIEGVNNIDFLKTALMARLDKPINLYGFAKDIEKLSNDLKLKENMLYRNKDKKCKREEGKIRTRQTEGRQKTKVIG